MLGGNSETHLLDETMCKLLVNLKVIMELAEHRREQNQCFVWLSSIGSLRLTDNADGVLGMQARNPTS